MSVGLQHDVHSVLRHQPADHQDIAALLQAIAGQVVVAGWRRQLGAVGDVGGRAAEARGVEALDDARIGHRALGQARREPFGQAQVQAGACSPLRALGVQAVHVEHRGDARQAGQPDEGTVAGDEVDGHVGP